MPLETPIAFCFFNRPDVTLRVFESIAKIQPKKLLLIGDGPRKDRPDDHSLVAQTRAIVQNVDWDCDVLTNLSDTNLGCAQRIGTGLSWAFEQCEELIILEDDCLPDPSFYGFCECLLQRYRDDERVMMISGDNFQPTRRTDNSYYFSRWPHIWGWASWSRAWQHFDLEIKSWPQIKLNQQLSHSFSCPAEESFWTNVFDQIRLGAIDTWDFSWTYACWANNGLTILPESNLISNLGFCESATHTIDPMSKLANLPVTPITSLTHPEFVERNLEADNYTWANVIAPPPKPALRKKKWYRRFFENMAYRTLD